MASGAVTPCSVPAILEVYPEMKWYMTWLLLSFDTGGRTPRASQVRRMMFVGWDSEIQGIFALGMKSMG